ncbi:transmembrane protein 17 isoform X3 [Callithrix jacchus]
MDLPDPVRQRLGTFSRAVFSDSNRTGPEYNEGPENEMVSSLALQMSLYFNTYYFPLWWVSSIMMLHVKYSILPDYYKFIVITVIILITLIEAIRLYLGYMGNLQEKISMLYFVSVVTTRSPRFTLRQLPGDKDHIFPGRKVPGKFLFDSAWVKGC